MKTLSKFLLVLALGAFICLPGMASATPLVDLYEVRVDNDVQANIYAPGFGNIGVYAGNYIVAIRNPSGSGNPYVEYSGYCTEPALSSKNPLVYELLPIAEGSAFEAAAWILSQGYTTLAPAAQAAVWELTWDTALGKSFSLTADNFRLNSGINATDVTNIYDAAIAQMGVGGFDPSPYMIAHNPDGVPGWAFAQDYIIPIPLPPSALLLGTGILGLVGLGWRRRKAS